MKTFSATNASGFLRIFCRWMGWLKPPPTGIVKKGWYQKADLAPLNPRKPKRGLCKHMGTAWTTT